jgi:cell division transport system permease protein
VFAFVAFSLRRAWKSFWRNGLMSLAATATMILMLLLLSGVVILLNGLDMTLKYVSQEVQVVAYLKDSSATTDVNRLETTLAAMPQVTNVKYVSKEQALKDFQARQPDAASLVDSLNSNPLPASLEINLRAPDDYLDVASYLRSQDPVSSVQDIKATVDQMVTVINVLRTGGIATLVVVGLIVLFIIVNSIRMAVVARADEIEIMRLVGASDAFIRWPFIFEGAIVGLIGAAVTIGLLLLVRDSLVGFMSSFFSVFPGDASALVGQNLVLLVLGTGVGIGVLGSSISVRSYLRR